MQQPLFSLALLVSSMRRVAWKVEESREEEEVGARVVTNF